MLKLFKKKTVASEICDAPKIPKHIMNIAMDIFRFVSGISLIAALIFIILEIVPIAILMVSVLFVICMTSLSI